MKAIYESAKATQRKRLEQASLLQRGRLQALYLAEFLRQQPAKITAARALLASAPYLVQ